MPETNALPDMVRELGYHPIEREPKTLTKEQIKYFNEKGYIFPLDLFDEGEAQADREYFEELVALAEKSDRDSYSIIGWHRHCRGLYELVTNPRVLDIVEDIVGPNIICTNTHYFSKTPGDVKSVYWHQDAQFWAQTPSKVVSVWLAIDDVDEENGAMNLFPGTHLQGVIPFEYVTDEENGVLNQHIHNAEQYAKPVSVNLKAGQISLHTDMIIHGSMPNPSKRRRCGLTMRYLPPDVRGRDPESSSAVICRGSDPEGYWQDIPVPEGDSPPPSVNE